MEKATSCIAGGSSLVGKGGVNAKSLAGVIPPWIPNSADFQNGGMEDAEDFLETIVIMITL